MSISSTGSRASGTHLEDVHDGAVLEAELARVRIDYNAVTLHVAISYVTPEDERYERGRLIRETRWHGLERAPANNRWSFTAGPNQPGESP